MRRVSLFIAAAAIAAFATSASAQFTIPNFTIPVVAGGPSHYDPYYVLPGEAGSIVGLAGIETSDIGSIADVSMIPVVAKYSVSDQIEVGVRLDLGVLNDGADALSTAVIGAKYGMNESMAISAGLLVPALEADDPGLSVGVMKTISSGDLMINNWLQVGLLDGYTGGNGINVDLLVEPTKAFGDKFVGYLDLLVSTNTDEIGDNLGIDLAPNVDIMINDNSVVNVGVTVGVAGDMKADDVGMLATFIMGF